MSDRPRRRLAWVSAGSGAAVCALAVGVHVGWPPLSYVDERVLAAATGVAHRRPTLASVLVAWQEVFMPWRLYVAATPLLWWGWRAGLRRRAVWAGLAGLSGWAINWVAKQVVGRPRPTVDAPLTAADGYSFPSGHAFNVTFCVLVVGVLVWPWLGSRGWMRRLAVTAGVALVILTAADRVFLGVHYLSDTVAGVLWGVSLAAGATLLLDPRPGERTQR